jgi:hypothetical protein
MIENLIEVWEFGNEPEYNVGSRGGVVSILRDWEYSRAVESTERRARERGHYTQRRDAGRTREIEP